MIFKKIFLLFLFSAGILLSQKSPKNIIIFIGDGMGLNYVTANIFTDKNSQFGRFTSTGLSLTCSADHLITDSGAGATAISTGYRTKNLAIGVDTAINPVITIMEIASQLEMSTGVIATSSVTNATPAAFLSHVPHRKMEKEIAQQIAASGADVIIGGGSDFFSPSEKKGKQDQKVDLIDSVINRGYNFYGSIEELRKGNKKKPFYALLEPEALKRAIDRNYGLNELVAAALENLQQDDDGFVLMVEGSQIDWAAHDHLTRELLKELSDFSDALNVALDFAEEDNNTLVLVTSDHETGGGSINGGELDGSNLKLEYTSSGHTGGMVGIFSTGPGEENFRTIMQNNEIGRKLINLLKPDHRFTVK